jgi:hypothetical protein
MLRQSRQLCKWQLTRRNLPECFRPVLLRVFTGLLSLLTCLLIVAAASKMLLYIDSYGLTPLRVYTTWFMALLLLVFLLLVAWHARPFNAARPLIILVVAAVLALGLINTNGIIANHNAQRYLDGRAAGHAVEVDVEFLAQLGDAAMPALYELREQADDRDVVEAAARAIDENYRLHTTETDEPTRWRGWQNGNLQYLQTMRLHAEGR